MYRLYHKVYIIPLLQPVEVQQNVQALELQPGLQAAAQAFMTVLDDLSILVPHICKE